MQKIQVKDFFIGENEPLTVISGPCVIEEDTFAMAKELKEIFSHFPFSFIFKSSYDKANRSSISSYRGPGLKKGLKILEKIKGELDLPILTDVHTPEEAKEAANVCDILQIPAFLCRQTDLVVAAGKTKAVINIKKGQFMAPWDMKNVIEKVLSASNNQLFLTERGISFGYNTLVSDMRSIPIMQAFGYPVCFDATHSVQTPSGKGNLSGGEAEFIPTLSKAAVAAGANALYLEAHKEPKKAKSDPFSMIGFEELKKLLYDVEKIYRVLQAP